MVAHHREDVRHLGSNFYVINFQLIYCYSIYIFHPLFFSCINLIVFYLYFPCTAINPSPTRQTRPTQLTRTTANTRNPVTPIKPTSPDVCKCDVKKFLMSMLTPYSNFVSVSSPYTEISVIEIFGTLLCYSIFAQF